MVKTELKIFGFFSEKRDGLKNAKGLLQRGSVKRWIILR